MLQKREGIHILYILIVLLSLFITFVPELSHNALFFELLVQSRPYIIAVLFILALFFVFKRFYLLAVIQMMAVLGSVFFVSGAYLGNQGAQSCLDNQNLKPIRVMSFNIYYQNHNYEEITRAIEAVDADIVLLQEVQSGLYHYGHERLLKKYAFHYSDLERGIAHGKAIYSKYPIESVKKEELLGSHHRALRARLSVNDQIINAIAIHTYSPKNQPRIKDRNEHIGALARYIAALDKEGHAIVIAGDFNSTPWHPVMKAFKEQTQLNNNGFYNIIGTWPTWLPSFLTIPIDHIFYNNSFGHSNYYRGLLSGSDHYPIYVDLQICE